MSKYMRIKDGRIARVTDSVRDQIGTLFYDDNKGHYISEKNVLKQSDIIKELIEIGDLVVYYNTNSKRYEYIYIHNEDELFAIKHLPINNLFIKVGNDFVLAASAKDKGELELL